MTNQNLAAIEARCAAATPGPWVWHHDLWHGLTAEQLDAYDADPEGAEDPFDGKTTEDFAISWGDIIRPADGEFIAHARQDVPALAAELGRLRTQHRWDQHNLALYRRLVEGRQNERDQAVRREADLENRIDSLRSTVAEMLAAFTDNDPHPRCGSPRARSHWVPSRTLRQWRDQIVEAEPDQGAGQ